ncbi:MAG: 3-isopropylmalate dehydratase small subunit [Acidobacteriota bacterium]
MREPLRPFTSPLLPLLVDDVDTDQVIPARFLTSTDREGFGEHLFHDWRFDADGRERTDFVLAQPRARDARILLTGDNFGCGSSREHAVWALQQFGFRAVVARSFSDIFRGNALNNGLLPIELARTPHARLVRELEDDPSLELTVDLRRGALTFRDGRELGFRLEQFARELLLEGLDATAWLLDREELLQRYESARPIGLDTRRAVADVE